MNNEKFGTLYVIPKEESWKHYLYNQIKTVYKSTNEFGEIEVVVDVVDSTGKKYDGDFVVTSYGSFINKPPKTITYIKRIDDIWHQVLFSCVCDKIIRTGFATIDFFENIKQYRQL